MIILYALFLSCETCNTDYNNVVSLCEALARFMSPSPSGPSSVFICKPTEVLKPLPRSQALMCFLKAFPEWKERNAAECLVLLQVAAVMARLHRHKHVQWLLCTLCKLITFKTTEVFKLWESGHCVWPYGPSGPNFRHVV